MKKVSHSEVKDKILSGDVVAHNNWSIHITASDDVLVFPPEGEGFAASLMNLDAAISEFCEKSGQELPGEPLEEEKPPIKDLLKDEKKPLLDGEKGPLKDKGLPLKDEKRPLKDKKPLMDGKGPHGPKKDKIIDSFDKKDEPGVEDLLSKIKMGPPPKSDMEDLMDEERWAANQQLIAQEYLDNETGEWVELPEDENEEEVPLEASKREAGPKLRERWMIKAVIIGILKPNRPKSFMH